MQPEHVSFLLNYYSQLKQETYEELDCDMRWLLVDLENLIERTLKAPDYSSVPNALLYDLVICKIDGLKNKEIVAIMEAEHGITHSEQYYSTL